MRLFLLTLVLGIGGAAPVRAQTTDYRSFLPLAPGNVWVYDVTIVSGSSSGYSSGYLGARWTVLDSVTVAAGRLPRVQIETGNEVIHCLVSTEVTIARTIFSLLDAPGEAPCEVDGIGSGFALGDNPDIIREVEIGGVDYGARRTNSWYMGNEIPSTDYSGSAVEAIGLLDFRRYTYIGTGYYGSTEWTLRWAHVDGQTYGQPIAARPDFWPLTVGNRWEYRLTGLNGVDRGAVAWTVVSDGDSAEVRFEHIENSEVLASATCPVTVSAPSLALWRTRFRIHCTPLNGSMLFPANIDVGASEPNVMVEIGPDRIKTDLDTRVTGFFGPSWAQYSRWSAGRRIGIVGYTNSNTTGPSSSHYTWTATLAYAHVDGETYGQQVITADDAPLAARLHLMVGPNPTAGPLTVRFVLLAPSDVRLMVVDALGREVRTLDLGARPAGDGAATVALDGLAPGVYMVHLAAGDAAATARVSVVR